MGTPRPALPPIPGPLGPDNPFPNPLPSQRSNPGFLIPVLSPKPGQSPTSSSLLTYAPKHPTSNSPLCPPDLPNAHGLAVDWVSRNLFWTSYDTNKKQINVARLDGSFKNAVVQGLEQPHGLVVHPLRGSVPGPGLGSVGCGAEAEGSDLTFSHLPRKLYWTDGDNISMANMDGSNRTLLFSGQKGPVGTSLLACAAALP